MIKASYNSTVPGGNTVANTTGETAFTTKVTFGANTLEKGVYRLTLGGVFSTTGAPTDRFKLKIGSVVLADTGAVTMPTGASNLRWRAEIVFVVTAIGGSGTVEVSGTFHVETAATTESIVNIGGTGTYTVDTTASHDLTVTNTWGTASASNTITLRLFALEQMQ